MRKQIIAGLVTALGVVSLPAFSADNGIYLGAGIGQGGVQGDTSVEGFKLDFDASSNAYKLIGGWRFLDWLAVEGNYVDFGTADDKVQGEKLETDFSGFSLSAVGFLPLGPVDLFARVGAINWDANLDLPGYDIRGNEDGTDLTYGVGAQFRVWSLAFRAEYEIFDVEDADVDMISVGVTWTFL